MRKPALPPATRLGRLVREVRPDRNPLRRGVDRAEAAIAGVLLVVFLAGAPLTALTVGHWAHQASSEAARAQADARHRVPAVLLQNAYSPYGGTLHPRALAQWTAPDGSARIGTVPAPAGSARGRTVQVWTNGSGRVTGAPPPPGDADLTAGMATAAAVIVLTCLLAGAGALARHELNRRRLAAWEAAWRVTGPQWTGLR